MLNPWRKRPEEKTEKPAPFPPYADFLELMEYEVQESKAPDHLLNQWLDERGGDGTLVHTPLIYAVKGNGRIPGRETPYPIFLETEPERVAFLTRFNHPVEVENPKSKSPTILPGPLTRWNNIPTLFDHELPYLARYAPVADRDAWPDLWIQAATPEDASSSDEPLARDRYMVSFQRIG